jgi:predicted DNA-binding transcriptional regulator AlpA
MGSTNSIEEPQMKAEVPKIRICPNLARSEISRSISYRKIEKGFFAKKVSINASYAGWLLSDTYAQVLDHRIISSESTGGGE